MQQLLFPIYKNGMEISVEVWFLETLVREVYFTMENRWFDKVAQLPTNYANCDIFSQLPADVI